MTNEQLAELFNKLFDVYKQLQWSKEVVIGDVYYNYCPLCDQAQGRGHLENCPCFELNKKLPANET